VGKKSGFETRHLSERMHTREDLVMGLTEERFDAIQKLSALLDYDDADSALFALDELGIYGEDILKFFTACEEDAKNVLMVLLCFRSNLEKTAERKNIHYAVKMGGGYFNFERMKIALKKKNPRFGKMRSKNRP
jgi:hypothetical protein